MFKNTITRPDSSEKKLEICLSLESKHILTQIDGLLLTCLEVLTCTLCLLLILEEAIAGVTTGLISLGDSVTWRAKHFGIYQNLTSKITAFNAPSYFVDEMVKGAFKRFKHEHIFEERDGGTLMIDVFDYDSPLGILGKIADALFLEKYMTRLLTKRNDMIKEFAESEKWKGVPGMG